MRIDPGEYIQEEIQGTMICQPICAKDVEKEAIMHRIAGLRRLSPENRENSYSKKDTRRKEIQLTTYKKMPTSRKWTVTRSRNGGRMSTKKSDIVMMKMKCTQSKVSLGPGMHLTGRNYQQHHLQKRR
jgi:hypothetical protein